MRLSAIDIFDLFLVMRVLLWLNGRKSFGWRASRCRWLGVKRKDGNALALCTRSPWHLLSFFFFVHIWIWRYLGPFLFFLTKSRYSFSGANGPGLHFNQHLSRLVDWINCLEVFSYVVDSSGRCSIVLLLALISRLRHDSGVNRVWWARRFCINNRVLQFVLCFD